MNILLEGVIMSEEDIDENFELPSVGSIKHYASLILEGNPDLEGSRELLKVFCARAKELSAPSLGFPEPIIEIIVLAFEKYLSGEENNINKSLGLVRRGRPITEEIIKRNHYIAADVERLVRLGKNKTVSKMSDGAFYLIGKKYSLSESEIQDIYYKYRDEGITIIKIEGLDTDPA